MLTYEELDQIANKVAARVIQEVTVKVLDLPEHELLMHFTEHAMTGHALVVDESRAKASPCRCFTYEGRDYCWTRGAIGLLTQEQEASLCQAGKSYEVKPGVKERFEKFAEAAAEAHKKIEEVPKGERLVPWLTAMGRELSERGIKV